MPICYEPMSEKLKRLIEKGQKALKRKKFEEVGAHFQNTVGVHEGALALMNKALSLTLQRASAYGNTLWILVHFSEIDANDVLELAGRFDHNLCRELLRADDFRDRNRDPDRRLRIGWLGSDMNSHPVDLFVLPYRAALDHKDVVETLVYSNAKRIDPFAEMLKSHADVWCDVTAIGDDALADLIRADEIDVLIDLNGNAEGNRQMALARKPAPIMVTWLGFPGTSGMLTMDYIFAPPDPVPERPGWSSETPWPLLEEQFEQYGITPERLDVRGYSSKTEYFASYNEADLYLDPFPFNGGATAYDTIWMSVPFAILPGDMLVSRMGKAILDNVGLSALVAADADTYVDHAVTLAQDRERLKTLRLGLREKMRSSP